MTESTPLHAVRSAPATVGVLICTYGRPSSLVCCLRALAAQSRLPDDILLVIRDTDTATHALLAARGSGLPPFRTIPTSAPGLITARNAGLDACRTELVVFLDDDTAPHPDWLKRITEHFARDPNLGGVGGSDRVHDGVGFDERRMEVVGQVLWFGRIIGNHHLGYGAPREVDVLKGANMAYRAVAIANLRFDVRLRGKGAPGFDDYAFSLAVRRHGWKLLYDPAATVDHFPGQRGEGRAYVGVSKTLEDLEGCYNLAFNAVVALWDELSPPRLIAFALWSALIGTGPCPGLAQAVRYTPRLGLASWRRFWVTQQGKAVAFWQLGRGGDAALPRSVGKERQVIGKEP